MKKALSNKFTRHLKAKNIKKKRENRFRQELFISIHLINYTNQLYLYLYSTYPQKEWESILPFRQKMSFELKEFLYSYSYQVYKKYFKENLRKRFYKLEDKKNIRLRNKKNRQKYNTHALLNEVYDYQYNHSDNSDLDFSDLDLFRF